MVDSTRARKITSLIGDVEVVVERMPGGDRALSDKRRAVCPVCSVLKKTVPMLQIIDPSACVQGAHVQTNAHNGRRLQHVFICEFVDHVDLKVVALDHGLVNKENLPKRLD